MSTRLAQRGILHCVFGVSQKSLLSRRIFPCCENDALLPCVQPCLAVVTTLGEATCIREKNVVTETPNDAVTQCNVVNWVRLGIGRARWGEIGQHPDHVEPGQERVQSGVRRRRPFWVATTGC